uniref:NADH dehydrogenase subunit 4 n=1 Tax=Apanteles gelechiidivoris TaxID=1911542 RepID=UPI00286A347F|nr:NADH dehydrogenase subunit 4 [Apanteles gelechiidivoris]WKW91665.1 NADH dehydrogenase subunit 4 [Apanteles gelechiidivoris]WLN31483.1 NADH dehydrogenase subunit 4 [Apanteles gelechiidivoris]
MMKYLMIMFFMNFLSNKNYKVFFNHLILMFLLYMLIMKMNLNNFFYSNIFFGLSFDFVSFMLIILSFWIIILSNLANLNFLNLNYKIYFIYIMNNMLLLLLLCFFSMNLLFFYIFFESSIIPILLMIFGWGLQIDRLQASMYLLMYTLFGSLPLLFMMMLIYKDMNSLIFMFLNMNLNYNLSYNLTNYFSFIMIILAFLIKMPMYLFHLWLPKAHVEAPVSGSMILAGIMLKLGSYGLIRFIMFMKYIFVNFNFFIINISLMGGIYASMMCLNINDLKIIVAYSSVVHMSLLMASMLTLNYWGYMGSYIMMIAHGLCSSAMFYLVNLNYERIHSRSLMINKGLINILPSLTFWWFMICTINMSAPPSMNLISEIMMFNSLISWSNLMILYLIMLSFFGSCYSIFIFSFSQHGKYNFNLFNFEMINCLEYFNIIFHWLPLNFIILNLNLMF